MKRLTEKELAARWGMTHRTLQGWRATGKGPAFIRIGERSIFYREEDVLAYEASSIVGGPATEPEGWRDAMRLNLHCRLAQRVLVELIEGPYRHEEDLYSLARRVDWRDWITPRPR